MATTLVDINRTTTSKVRVLNPLPEEVKLWQDAEIGMAEKIDQVASVITDMEHTTESDNMNRVRRVGQASEKRSDFASLPRSTEKLVPEHLRELYDRSSYKKSNAECEIIAGLLVKYSDTFSKGEWYLGTEVLSWLKKALKLLRKQPSH